MKTVATIILIAGAASIVTGVGTSVAFSSQGSVTVQTPEKQRLIDSMHPWDTGTSPTAAATKVRVGPPAEAPSGPRPGALDRKILNLDQTGGVPLPMPAVGFSVDTIMSETLNTDYVTVIAGATAEAPMQPVLRVMTSDPSTGITTTQDYLLPSGRGQAHLDRISGQTLSVSDAGKTRSYSFDVSTGTLG